MNFQEWQRELQEWHSPRGFSDKLRAMRAEHGLNLLTAPEAGFFRDAHPAYQFAFLREATGLRVGLNPPDFELDVADGARKFEVTEADAPGRKRNDEIKGRRAFDETWITPELAGKSLRASAVRKSDGRYPPDYGLLIFLNLVDPWDVQETRLAIGALLADATAVAKARFAEVWVLWQGSAYNAWLDGRPGSRVLRQPSRTEKHAGL